MKMRIAITGLGLLILALTGCTVAVDDEPSATPQPQLTPSREVHPIYGVLPDREASQPLDQTFLYEGPLSEVESFCLLSDSGVTCTSEVEGIAAALGLPDLSGTEMVSFVGLPLFAVTDDGQLWGVRQPYDGETGAVRAELAQAIDDAEWRES